MLRYALLLILTIVSSQTVSAAVVRIADGDCTGLSNAVTAAATASGQTTILLARNGNYAACSISMNTGDVVIDGQGAQMQFLSACIGDPYNGAIVNASLALQNLSIGSPVTIASQQLCSDGGFIGGLGAISTVAGIYNSGSLILDSVTLQNLTAPTSWYDGFIVSVGSLVLRNVTVANANQQIGGGAGLGGSIINSFGSMEVYNSTFSHSSAGLPPDGSPMAAIINATNATITNSLFAANTSVACSGAITSLGGNVATESSCGFSASAGDKIVQDAGLDAFGNHGGLIPTQAISFGSPARGVGIAQYCEAVDARGYTRAPNGCDAGAYEYGGGAGALIANGMNGFYYDPDANGHYVSLQRVHDNGDIVIVWDTFDQRGNQAWIYGVGQLSGQHIHANMSQNVGGVLQAGGPPTGSTVRPWGTVDIDLTSCLLAQFNYQSNLANFGSGQFPLTRLALVSDFGCSD